MLSSIEGVGGHEVRVEAMGRKGGVNGLRKRRVQGDGCAKWLLSRVGRMNRRGRRGGQRGQFTRANYGPGASAVTREVYSGAAAIGQQIWLCWVVSKRWHIGYEPLRSGARDGTPGYGGRGRH